MIAFGSDIFYLMIHGFSFFDDLCRAQLFDLAVSLLPGLGFEEVDLLFVAIVPALKVCDSFNHPIDAVMVVSSGIQLV